MPISAYHLWWTRLFFSPVYLARVFVTLRIWVLITQERVHFVFFSGVPSTIFNLIDHDDMNHDVLLFFCFSGLLHFSTFSILCQCKKQMLTTAPYFVCVCDQDSIYIIDKIINMEKHMEIPRKSWIRSINMKCSKQMLTTAPYCVCDYNKNYIYIYIYSYHW